MRDKKFLIRLFVSHLYIAYRNITLTNFHSFLSLFRSPVQRVLPLLIILLLVACQQKQSSFSAEELNKQDQQVLHVAVLPIMECLPLYYAQQMGLFNAEDVDIALQTYLSQMDCDTAILHGQVEVACGDVVRTLLMPEAIHLLSSMDGKLSLITAKSKRIRQIKHLDERMVAIDRFSQTDYWSDELMKQAGLDLSAIYRPQINDIQLRTSMLTEQLVDAALLPEPYATLAVMKGNRRLFVSNDSALSFSCFIASDSILSDTMRIHQIQKLFAIYDKAVELLNSDQRNNDSLHILLCQQYSIPAELADSIKIPCFHKLSKIKSKDLDKICQWLETRERYVTSQRRDSLCNNLFVQ